MAQTTEQLRSALLAAAESELVASADGDIATRAVCEIAGVTQPVLYRIFGDKRGLLDALVETGFERYTARKAGLEKSDDPVDDLLAGWDDHMAFASENPALYQLMFTPRPWVGTRARARINALLTATLTRCAAAGALRVPVEQAAAMVLSANVGLALNRIAEPALYAAPAVSRALRDALFTEILSVNRTGPVEEPLASAVSRLDAQLTVAPATPLAPEEIAVLRLWLKRLAQSL